MRIVSLLPSATEIVCALGLRDELVGITHECDWPPEVEGIPVMTRNALEPGRTGREIHQRVSDAIHGGSAIYELDEAALEAAAPDLILTQELCEVCAVSYRTVNEVAKAIELETTVVSLEPTSLEGIFNTISTVGAMTEAEREAIDVVRKLRKRLGAIERKVLARRQKGHEPPRVVALEWLDPPFAVGHWVPEQIRRSGGWDLLGLDGEASRETTWESIVEVDPEMLVFMPCGMNVDQTVAEIDRLERPEDWGEIHAVRRRNVFAVDGSAYFSRPGPRVIDGMEMLAEIFDPDAFIDTAPLGSWTPILEP
jgi:iron complex transport system substrate-binding protein